MKTMKMKSPAPYPELRGIAANIRYPAFIEPKRDGEYNMAFSNKEKTILVNKHGTGREDCPITYALSQLMREFVVLGELCYSEGLNGDLYSLLSNKKNGDVLTYFIFDIAELDGKSVMNQPLIDRKELLIEVFRNFRSAYVKLNPVYVCESKEQMEDRHKLIVEAGFEGSVIKNMDAALLYGPCGWAKVKTTDVNSFPVITIDPAAERIEVLVTSTLCDGRKIQKPCGVKASSAQKKDLLLGVMVDIKHYGILSGGGLRHPVLMGKTKGG